MCKEKFHEFTHSVMDEIDIMATPLLLLYVYTTRSFTFFDFPLFASSQLWFLMTQTFFDEFYTNGILRSYILQGTSTKFTAKS